MIALELGCVAILALYLGVRTRRDAAPRRFLWRLLVLMAASFAGEDTVIRAYGFYTYSPRWSLFIDRVPLMIITIWPVVISSAWDLVRHLRRDRGSVAALAVAVGLLVWADASLIEPIAVRSGLWWWHQPGLFRVPPVGILGWGFFAGLCIAVLESNRRAARSPLADLRVLLVAPLGTHALLLGSWWGLLRWVSLPVPTWPAVGLAWAVALALTALALRRGGWTRVPLAELLLRVPAAGFFFVLLALNSTGAALPAYAVAVAPPYLTLTAGALRRR